MLNYPEVTVLIFSMVTQVLHSLSGAWSDNALGAFLDLNKGHLLTAETSEEAIDLVENTIVLYKVSLFTILELSHNCLVIKGFLVGTHVPHSRVHGYWNYSWSNLYTNIAIILIGCIKP